MFQFPKRQRQKSLLNPWTAYRFMLWYTWRAYRHMLWLYQLSTNIWSLCITCIVQSGISHFHFFFQLPNREQKFYCLPEHIKECFVLYLHRYTEGTGQDWFFLHFQQKNPKWIHTSFIIHRIISLNSHKSVSRLTLIARKQRNWNNVLMKIMQFFKEFFALQTLKLWCVIFLKKIFIY